MEWRYITVVRVIHITRFLRFAQSLSNLISDTTLLWFIILSHDVSFVYWLLSLSVLWSTLPVHMNVLCEEYFGLLQDKDGPVYSWALLKSVMQNVTDWSLCLYPILFIINFTFYFTVFSLFLSIMVHLTGHRQNKKWPTAFKIKKWMPKFLLIFLVKKVQWMYSKFECQTEHNSVSNCRWTL